MRAWPMIPMISWVHNYKLFSWFALEIGKRRNTKPRKCEESPLLERSCTVEEGIIQLSRWHGDEEKSLRYGPVVTETAVLPVFKRKNLLLGASDWFVFFLPFLFSFFFLENLSSGTPLNIRSRDGNWDQETQDPKSQGGYLSRQKFVGK